MSFPIARILRTGAFLWLPAGLCLGQPPAHGASSGPADNARCILEARRFDPEAWNGENNVSAAIQMAVDAAATNRAVIRLPAGTWALDRAVVMKNNVTLEGAATGTVFRPTAANGSNPVLLEFPPGTADVLVRRIAFDGGGSGFANPSPLVAATAATNIVFDRVTVRNSRGIGLLLQGGMRESGVRDSRFLNLGNRWKTTLNKADRIQGLVFCCGRDNTNNFATGNYFQDIGLDALQIGDQTGFCAANNVFELENGQFDLVAAPDFPAAIFALHSERVVMAGNVIHNAAGNGIDAPGLRYSIISNNVVIGCGGCGIGLFLGYDGERQVEGVSVVMNTVKNNARWNRSSFIGGITIAGGAPSDIFLSANTVTDDQEKKTQAYGLQVRENTKVSGLKIDHRNRLAGNRLGELQGAKYSAP